MHQALIDAAEMAQALTFGRAGSRVPVLGVSGPQGSGKSTLVEAMARDPGRQVAVISLDDVYLTAEERRELAARVHPLLATRGPPGTHDLGLLVRTLDALQEAGPQGRTPLPRFDKRADTRRPMSDWPVFAGRPDLILVDGWCLGASPQTRKALAEPVNDLERREDPDDVWRDWVNDQLSERYGPLWDRFDAILVLDAPGWEIVPRWRMQQEEGLLGRPLAEAEQAGVRRFCAHFERITRSMMAGARRADVVVRLDAERRVSGVDAP